MKLAFTSLESVLTFFALQNMHVIKESPIPNEERTPVQPSYTTPGKTDCVVIFIGWFDIFVYLGFFSDYQTPYV